MKTVRQEDRILSSFIRYVIISSLIVFVVSTSPLYSETIVGGSVSSEYYLESTETSFSQSISVSGDLLVSSYSDMITFSANVHVNEQMLVDDSGFEHAHITPELLLESLSLSSFSLEFYPLNQLTISIGKFPSRYGQSEIINPLLVFSQIDYAALLKGDLEDSQLFPFLLKTSLYSESLSLDLLIAPYIPEYSSFPVNSPWFPMKDFPEQLDMGGAGLKDLDGISYQDEVFIDGKENPFSLQLGLSGVSGSSDYSLFGFYGWNSDYPLTTILSFDTDTYSVALKPNYQKVFSLGAAFSSSYDRVRLFSDVLYTPHKLFSSNWFTFHSPYSVVTLQQKLIAADSIAYTLGGSIDIPEWYSFIQIEYYDLYIMDQEAKNIPEQRFSQLFSTIVRFTEPKGVVSANLLSLYSVADASSALFIALQAEFSQEFVCEVTVPFFFGKPSSDFGQYKDHCVLTFSCKLNF